MCGCCTLLMALHIPVLGVERDRSAPFLSLARRLGIPVFIGDGTERRVLGKLQLSQCRALAAVGSDDLENIAVAVAAAVISPSKRVVLRAGEHEAISEGDANFLRTAEGTFQPSRCPAARTAVTKAGRRAVSTSPAQTATWRGKGEPFGDRSGRDPRVTGIRKVVRSADLSTGALGKRSRRHPPALAGAG